MAFLDELISPFLSQGAPTNRDNFAFGQLFWTPVYYPHQRLEIWRPDEVHQKFHTAKNFNIKSGLPDCFNRPLPYTSPHLEITEEFIALKAKRRPVILIQPPDVSLKQVKTGPMGIKLARHLCVAAPLFGLENQAGHSRASEEFISRVRQLEYPQFTFLPKGGPLTKDSLLRLDEIQSVAVQNLEHTGFALSAEARSFFRSQVAFFMGGFDGGEFAGYRELLASE